jgi:hypothetical protein
MLHTIKASELFIGDEEQKKKKKERKKTQFSTEEAVLGEVEIDLSDNPTQPKSTSTSNVHTRITTTSTQGTDKRITWMEAILVKKLDIRVCLIVLNVFTL